MIIADENIFDIIIAALQKEGYEVLSIKNTSLRGISDIDIASFSLLPPRIIITEDTDFGEIVFLQKRKLTGVILLRYKNFERPLIIDLLIEFLKDETLETLTNKFVTITSEKIRIKNIEEQK